MNVQFKIWRGDANSGAFQDYTAECSEGMVVLDAVHQIQRTQANDLACRWNCKAGKCGSCSAEVNGMPKLMCMARLSDLPLDRPVTIEPMKAFPVLKDLIAAARCTRWHMADAASRHRSGSGIPEMHRMFSLPGCLPRASRPSDAR